MVGRGEQVDRMKECLSEERSAFIAVTGRRRVGKTYLIREVYNQHFCFSVTGIQNASLKSQIANFMNKLEEYAPAGFIRDRPKNWQEVFILFKRYLKQLPQKEKQVIFIDELPWMATAKSGFAQLLAHLWNDYLSGEKHFILVVCGSSTSWITNNILNDKGGFHNRVTLRIHLDPFTLKETKAFFEFKKHRFTPSGIAELYMTLGGLPYYLEQIKRGETPAKAIERICFSTTGALKNEYANLYKALFNNWEYHEAIVKTLAAVHNGMTREELVNKSGVSAGGPFTRTINELVLTGFVTETNPFQRKKRGTVYRLVDEFSVFYHRFMKANHKKDQSVWQTIVQSPKYKIWRGFAFETLCMKHVDEIKEVLGIRGVYTQVNTFQVAGTKKKPGFQIDLLIDRADACIHLCECKFYESGLEISKKYAGEIKARRSRFIQETGTKKMVLNTFISNESLIENEHSNEVADVFIPVERLM